MIQERVRAGLARARSEGKRLGRPPRGGDRSASARFSKRFAVGKFEVT
jgi:DNA invertase Pin-like site-specific DNA recombinase